MSEDSADIQFREYADQDLPEALKLQVLCFLRIIWSGGFTGPDQFRDQITDPALHPHHLLYAAGTQLVSHLELVTTSVTVNGAEYRVQSPTTVLTYPAFRGDGWSTRLNREAAARIDNSDADIGVLMCAVDLIDFYRRTGWTHASGASIVAGPDGDTWTSDDLLMTRPTSPRRLLNNLPYCAARCTHTGGVALLQRADARPQSCALPLHAQRTARYGHIVQHPPSSAQFLDDLRHHPLRVAGEW